MNKSEFRDKIILACWILGLLFIITLVWILFQPLQANYLLRTVNNVLASSGDSRRLENKYKTMGQAELAAASAPASMVVFGYWYTIRNSADKMFVFSFFRDGIHIPLGAIVSDNGTVNEIIPLGLHAKQVFDTLSPSVLKVFINRIENASLAGIEGRNK